MTRFQKDQLNDITSSFELAPDDASMMNASSGSSWTSAVGLGLHCNRPIEPTRRVRRPCFQPAVKASVFTQAYERRKSRNTYVFV